MFRSLLFILSSLLLVAIAHGQAPDAKKSFDQTLQPFFAKYCNDCHADGADEGGLDLSLLSADLADVAAFARWERIFDRVQSGEMPPQDSASVTGPHNQAFQKILGAALRQSHEQSKGTVYRRLNRREYENTLNDLFGTNLDLESLLPEDGRSHEFDNVGDSLSISDVQMRRYLEAIDLVLETAIEKKTQVVQPAVVKANYADTREGEKHVGKAWKLAPDGAVVFFRALGYPTGMLRTAVARGTGRYKIRVTGYAYQSDKPITFSVGATTFQRGVEEPTYAYRTLPPGKPTTIELEAWMQDRFMVEITPWGISDDNYEIKKNGIDHYVGPGLAINEVELIGPLVDDFPSRGHRMLFDSLERTEIEPSNPSQKTKSWYVPQFQLAIKDVTKDVGQVLQRVSTSAFRRTTDSSDIQRYLKLFESQVKLGASNESALRTAVAAIFCSPDFLFLREDAGYLNDFALASRLSYFLTRTTPDAELLRVAATGGLSNDPAALLAQAARLLNDERNQRFIVDFTDAWLNLRDIEFTSPDQNLYPEFDRYLKFSMLQETRSFFGELIHQNLSVRNLVKSDFAMLNQRLAAHYGIDGVDHPEVRRVQLDGDSVRGGLLGQASVLKVSANGTNTSPVTRGVWVLERILGFTPPPPPAGIAGVEPDIRGASTLRELLAKHRDVDSCRSCHRMIDPPGFALESFDPIGGWRDRFRSLGDGDKVVKSINGKKVRYKLGPKVDASGELAGDKKFSGFVPFRELLANNEDVLAETLITKMLTFATGREMGFSDRAEIERMVKASKAKGHGIKDLINLVVTSTLFRKK